ncbi:MAG: hypothetical protein GXP28_06395 [Planctomycetes bacterium]|nr:hypothetical protein [Planctomycetota bacterium]
MFTKSPVLVAVCLLLGTTSVCWGAKPELVNFRQQPAQVGDQVGQKLAIDFDVSTTIVQSGQMANQDTATVRRRQDRLIEVLEVAGGRVRRARVSFPHSRYRSPENPDPTQLKVQIVEGKSYLVERRGEQLLVTDPQGTIPQQDEFEIVVNSVQTLGLPNPLAKFLLQRAISIGERIEVPHELAEQIMGFGDSLGQVQKFELELKELLVVDGQRCALFGATLEIRGHQDHPMEVDIKGSVTIQIDTCRTIEAKLAGPLHMTATEPSYQITAEGGLKLAIRSHYGSAK